ncbi:MFS transporter [Acinetobacter silvestris]|uniref:MFS transporter n=1 Tax=Acinetobacter silvestris TaxID=1977882 RepID=A0A1Y3CIN8_9GAMM|nr:MFS transporter [Acinetobacter silvestris]OTG65957.1 MFS transporter [Acinetobacter silvestris]
MNGIKESIPIGLDSISAEEQNATFKKVIFRIVPFIFLAYLLNIVDRINISFAKLRMSEDLLLSDAAYGIGTSLFFIGYLIFEIPSNMYLKRVGTRATLTRIMVLWGILTILMSTVESTTSFYVFRFLIGVAEAGFVPGVILYLTYWFPSFLRGRVTSIFLMAGLIAGIINGPLATWIMATFDGWLGLRDWQVLFVIEGIPAVLLGVFTWFWLVDKPEQAKWLTAREKRIVRLSLENENQTTGQERSSFKQVFLDPRVHLIGIVFLCIYSATNTITYWMPTLIQEFGVKDIRHIGLTSSLPFICALISMYLLCRSSDKHLERRWHLALTMAVGAISFMLLGLVQHDLILSVVLLTIGGGACFSAATLFWTIPPAYLSVSAAALGIAWINVLGSLAAVVSPALVGTIKTQTGSIYFAFSIIGALLIFGGITILLAMPKRLLKEQKMKVNLQQDESNSLLVSAENQK